MSTGEIHNGSPSGSGLLAVPTTGSSRELASNISRSNRLKVLFVGYGRAGKDEAAQFCESHLGLRYGGSFSWHAKEDMARLLGVHPMTAWETRHKNRQFWKDECDKLRANDLTILAKRALATGDICAGLRDKVELDAVVAEGLFDRIVWVNNPRVPVDMTVTYTREDVLALPNGSEIINDGDLKLYHKRVLLFFHRAKETLKLSEYAVSVCL